MIELKHTKGLEEMSFAAMGESASAPDAKKLPKIENCTLDTEYAPVHIPCLVARDPSDDQYDTGSLVANDITPTESTYIVRGTIDEKDVASIRKQKSVVGVFADVKIAPTAVCPSGPVGTDTEVEKLLCTSKLHSCRMDGRGVYVAVVDTGVNLQHLNAHGKNPSFDASRSWVPRAGLVPGQLPVGHGTMVAFDVCIAAPKCTILDIALLQSQKQGKTVMDGLLSDAVAAYRHLIGIMQDAEKGGRSMSLVVNNSWGMFHPSWDFAVGHPGNYSDNPNHPFNLIVSRLEAEGADILFAAGNCGKDCPSSRCQGVTAKAIYGANGHPDVLCVAGVTVGKERIGYSSIGPGRLAVQKPDISGYTHFSGSGVWPADTGTSAACPVVAGVVAALRSVKPFNPADAASRPAAIRTIMRQTAQDLGAAGYDYHHGYGVVSGCALAKRYCPRIKPDPCPDLCKRYPWLCDPRRLCRLFPWLCKTSPFCRRFPQLCPKFPVPHPPIHGVQDISGLSGETDWAGAGWDSGEYGSESLLDGMDELDENEAAILMGYLLAQSQFAAGDSGQGSSGCGCGCKDKG